MKLYTIAWQNRPLVCLENRPGRLTPLPYETMNHLLADRPDHRAGVLEKAGKGSGEFALAEVQVLAPIPHPRQDVICLGMNYQKHKTEAERFDAAAFTREKAQAVYFSKRATHCPGPGAPIPGHFDLVDSLDYETELAVILGRDAKNVTEAEAFDYVFGYTIVNDVSARNLQTGHKQGPGRLYAHGTLYRDERGLSPAPGPGHPHLGQWTAAPGGGHRSADFFHPPHSPGALPGDDPTGRHHHRHRDPGRGGDGL